MGRCGWGKRGPPEVTSHQVIQRTTATGTRLSIATKLVTMTESPRNPEAADEKNHDCGGDEV